MKLFRTKSICQSVITWLSFSALCLYFSSLWESPFKNCHTVRNDAMKIKLHELCEEIKEKCNNLWYLPTLTTSYVSNKSEWILVIFSFVVTMTTNVNINDLLLCKLHLKNNLFKKILLELLLKWAGTNEEFTQDFFPYSNQAKSH